MSLLIAIFCSITACHPASTLFPYTTLFRSLRFEPRELLLRLCALVPPRGFHMTRYAGISRRDPPSGTARAGARSRPRDRKSTRLNSSHRQISYAVYCLKKKNFKPTSSDIPAAHMFHVSPYRNFLFYYCVSPCIYTLSLHDALPISPFRAARAAPAPVRAGAAARVPHDPLRGHLSKRSAFWDCARWCAISPPRSEEHTSELQSQTNLVCRLLLEKKKFQADE